MSEYANRDHMALGEFYVRHVSALTAENLHSKSAIAGELAFRDAEITRLRAELAQAGPDGWQFVPVEPTEAMLYPDLETAAPGTQLGDTCADFGRQIWARMLAAAPTAQAGAGPELWQYRWTNPACDLVSDDNMAWKRVVVRRMQTMQQRIDELLAYRYDGKPIYEVRGLYAHPAPALREPLSEVRVREMLNEANIELRSKWACYERGLRDGERAHDITPSGTKGAERTEDTAPGERANVGAKLETTAPARN